MREGGQAEMRLGPLPAGGFADFCRAQGAAFGEAIGDEEVAARQRTVAVEDILVAYLGDDMVGGVVPTDTELSVPGGVLAATYFPWAWVAPLHRRSGLLRQMMFSSLERLRERSVPLALLIPADSAVFSWSGFAPACDSVRLEIEAEQAGLLSPPDGGPLVQLDRDEALDACAAVYERVRRGQPGMLGRSAEMWRYFYVHDVRRSTGPSARELRGTGQPVFVGHRGPGGLDGYLAYRIDPQHDDVGPRQTVFISELHAATPEGYARLWNYAFELAGMGRVVAPQRSAEEPLPHLLKRPRALRRYPTDEVHLRLIDVRAALAGRRYSTEGELVIEVRDPTVPWNDGRFSLAGGPEGGSCETTDSQPDLSLTTRALGSCYLGGGSLASLARAGVVEEHTAGAVGRAAAMLSWSPGPWCPL